MPSYVSHYWCCWPSFAIAKPNSIMHYKRNSPEIVRTLNIEHSSVYKVLAIDFILKTTGRGLRHNSVIAQALAYG